MKYRRVLETIEALQYTGDFEELRRWYVENTGNPIAPFGRVGREATYKDITIHKGDYITLSPQGGILGVLNPEVFELTYRRVGDAMDFKKNKKKGR